MAPAPPTTATTRPPPRNAAPGPVAASPGTNSIETVPQVRITVRSTVSSRLRVAGGNSAKCVDSAICKNGDTAPDSTDNASSAGSDPASPVPASTSPDTAHAPQYTAVSGAGSRRFPATRFPARAPAPVQASTAA